MEASMITLKKYGKGLLCGVLALSGLMSFCATPKKPKNLNILPQKTVTYLQSKQVPAHLKKKLDDYFSSGMVQEALSRLYAATDWNKADRAKDTLTKMGFNFLGDKLHIFTHIKFPGYVFKMALPLANRTEILNASRIEYAEKMRAIIAAKKLKIQIPQKWAYFFAAKARMLYKLPRTLIVARKLNVSGPSKELTEAQKNELAILEKEANYYDIHEDNVYSDGTYIKIVDTEKHTEETLKALHAALPKTKSDNHRKRIRITMPLQSPGLIDDIWERVYGAKDFIFGGGNIIRHHRRHRNNWIISPTPEMSTLSPLLL
jgi:hypothetical protein